MNKDAFYDSKAAMSPGGAGSDDDFLDDVPATRDARERVDLRAVWSALYRNRWLITAVVGVALLLGISATLLMTPIYRAAASLQIEQQTDRVLGTEEEATAYTVQDADRFLETQLDIIRSRYLAERVAQELKLFGNGSFLAAMKIEVPDEPAFPLDQRSTEREVVLDALTENLSVSLPRNSRIAQIQFDSPDPVLAARTANAFATNLITANLQRKFDTTGYAREFLAKQLAEAKQRLEESERNMIAYARGARLLDTSAGVANEQQASGPRSLTASSLVQLNNSQAAVTAQRIQAEQRWRQASGTAPLALPEVLDNPAIQELVQQRAEQVALYQQERQRRREEHPSVQQAAARIAELNRQINTLAGNIKSGIQQQYRVAAEQERALSGNIARLKVETLAEQDRSVRYNSLKREADTNRQMYEGLLQRYREVSAEAGLTANNISLLDTADVPTEPVSPRPLLNMALAGLGGLGLAFLLVLMRERFDDVIRSPDDLEAKLGLVPLGVTPVLRGDASPAEELADPRSALTESYHALRTALELSSSAGLGRSLVVTSSQQGEGKSTTSFAVARDFARIGRRVLLVDADLRNPSMHKVLGLPNEKGLGAFLAGQSGWQELTQATPHQGLEFLPAGPLPPNPAELLASDRLGDLLNGLTATYDLVLVDAPPVMGLADSPLLASQAEGTIFVIEANRAHHGQAKIALRRLMSSQARILGAVLTKFDTQKIGYGEDYGYGYTYGS